MNEDISVLESLPPKHRKHIRNLYKAETKKLKAKSNDERLRIAASLLGAEGIAPYRELYLDEAGRLFAWLKMPATAQPDLVAALSPDSIAHRLHDRYQHALVGEHPDLVEGEDPQFVRMVRRGDIIELDYWYFGAFMSVPDGWNTITARRYRRCVVAVRQNPFTLEVRRTPASVRAGLLRSVRADLGIADQNLLVPCLLRTEELRTQLEALMDSVPHGEKRVGRGRGLGTFSITTDGSVSLLEQIDYVGSQAPHHEVFQKSWWFTTRHHDGYQEQAKYFITVETGELRVSEQISEVAIDNLRRNVLSLF